MAFWRSKDFWPVFWLVLAVAGCVALKHVAGPALHDALISAGLPCNCIQCAGDPYWERILYPHPLPDGPPAWQAALEERDRKRAEQKEREAKWRLRAGTRAKQFGE